MNQQSKYPQTNVGPSQISQKFDQFNSDGANNSDSQQSSSTNLLQNQFQRKTPHSSDEMAVSSSTGGAPDVVSSKSSPSLNPSSLASASLATDQPTNAASQTTANSTCEVSSDSLATSTASPTSFKSLSSGSSASFQSSSSTGNKWNAGSGFAGNMNFQGNQQYQSFVPSSDRFNYGYYSGQKSDISRDNSQSSRTSMGTSKSVTIRNAGNKSDASGGFNNGGNGGSFHSGLLRTGGVSSGGNVGVASRAECSGPSNFYSLNAKDIKDLQAEERKKAMMDIQSFLNPENKPPQKLLHGTPSSSSPSYLASSASSKPSNLSENVGLPGAPSIAGDKEVVLKTGEN